MQTASAQFAATRHSPQGSRTLARVRETAGCSAQLERPKNRAATSSGPCVSLSYRFRRLAYSGAGRAGRRMRVDLPNFEADAGVAVTLTIRQPAGAVRGTGSVYRSVYFQSRQAGCRTLAVVKGHQAGDALAERRGDVQQVDGPRTDGCGSGQHNGPPPPLSPAAVDLRYLAGQQPAAPSNSMCGSSKASPVSAIQRARR